MPAFSPLFKIIKYPSILIVASCFFMHPATLAEEYNETAKLINQRLSYMKQIAEYKAEKKLPIEDLDQENKVIAKSMADAESLGLNGESVRPFIISQIKAAKAIQYRYHADWLSNPDKNLHLKDLNEIRLKISMLSTEILKQVVKDLTDSQIKNNDDDCLFIKEIEQYHLENADKTGICLALKQIRLM